MMTLNATDLSGIVWYDLRTKYIDARIYPTMKTSILEDFRFRLQSQESNNKLYPFPIKLIRSIFTNASKIRSYAAPDEYDPIWMDSAYSLKKEFDRAIDTCADRILIYVADNNITSDGFSDSAAFIPPGMWAYPVAAIRSIGFKTDNGEVFIRLFREENNVRQVYSPNPDTSRWERVSGVQGMSQLVLGHRVEKREILIHNMPDLTAIKTIADMNISIASLKAADHRRHTLLWQQLFPLLNHLLREVTAVLSQYNLVLIHQSHSIRRGKESV